jgi:hypothetical protein
VTHWDWFAVFALSVIVFFLANVGSRLGTLIKRLEVTNDRLLDIDRTLRGKPE